MGQPTQLAAYSIPGQHRILVGQRVEGSGRISDHPAHGPGRRYLVERGLEQDGRATVDALIADYLAQAARYGQIPAEYVPIDA